MVNESSNRAGLDVAQDRLYPFLWECPKCGAKTSKPNAALSVKCHNCGAYFFAPFKTSGATNNG